MAMGNVIFKARREFHTNTGSLNNLLEPLSTFNYRLTSDPRDKVYSLLGITKPYPGPSLPVDYRVSTSDLFKRVALYIILGSQNLDILLNFRKSDTSPWNLPSWVPDWTDYVTHERVIINSISGWSVGGLQNQAVEALYDNDLLKVGTSIVGTVANLYPTDNTHSVTQWIEGLRKWTTIALPEACLPRQGHVSKLKQLRATFKVYRFLYEALFVTVYDRDTTQALLPFGDFVQLNIPGVAIEQLVGGPEYEAEFLLQSAMSPTRALFKGDIHENISGLHNARKLGICPRKGCRYPLILRQAEGTDHYEMIDEAYVQGVMHDEAFRTLPVLDICICRCSRQEVSD